MAVVTRLLLTSIALLLAISGVRGAAAAEGDGPAADGLMCHDTPPLQDRYTYLRSLSFYLRGHPPTMDEYRALDAQEDVTEAQIDALLSSDGFAERVVRLHRKLLWPNVGNVTVLGRENRMSTTDSGIWYRPERAGFYRGSSQLYDGVPCLDQEAEFDAQGGIIAYEDAGGLLREGWVLVQPYWAPEETLKVCGFDAQETAHASNGTACWSREGWQERDCGCGPNLDYCYNNDLNKELTAAMAKDLELRVARLVEDDVPYTELFTGRTAFVNGPMPKHRVRRRRAHWPKTLKE